MWNPARRANNRTILECKYMYGISVFGIIETIRCGS